jgi:hypothetical protein
MATDEREQFLEYLYDQVADEDDSPREVAKKVGKNMRGVSRREALQAGGALGIGALLGGGGGYAATQRAAADPSTSDSDGNVGLPDDRLDVFAEGIDSNSISTEIIDTNAGGSGYAWQDVLSSRNLDTWYQAPSDRDIWLSVDVQASVDGTQVTLQLDVNTSKNSNNILQRTLSVGQNDTVGLEGIRVPAGQYYQVKGFGASADYSLNTWFELR